MKNSKEYLVGIISLSFAYFLGYLWSPDYVEFISNGYNHLWITFLGIVFFILICLTDLTKYGGGR